MRDEELREVLNDIRGRLVSLDTAIRGNGQPGLNLRVDRLEIAARFRGRLAWLLAGTLATAGASLFVQVLVLMGN